MEFMYPKQASMPLKEPKTTSHAFRPPSGYSFVPSKLGTVAGGSAWMQASGSTFFSVIELVLGSQLNSSISYSDLKANIFYIGVSREIYIAYKYDSARSSSLWRLPGAAVK